MNEPLCQMMVGMPKNVGVAQAKFYELKIRVEHRRHFNKLDFLVTFLAMKKVTKQIGAIKHQY